MLQDGGCRLILTPRGTKAESNFFQIPTFFLFYCTSIKKKIIIYHCAILSLIIRVFGQILNTKASKYTVAVLRMTRSLLHLHPILVRRFSFLSNVCGDVMTGTPLIPVGGGHSCCARQSSPFLKSPRRSQVRRVCPAIAFALLCGD